MKFPLTMLVMVALAAACVPNPEAPDLPAVTVLGPNQSVPDEATATISASPGSTSTPTPTHAPRATGTANLATATPVRITQPGQTSPPEVDLAKADLAARLDIAPGAITVLAVEFMTWSDTSMGCPDPSMSYLQVLTEGLFIQLGYAGQIYNYHSGGGQPPFLCEQPAFGQ